MWLNYVKINGEEDISYTEFQIICLNSPILQEMEGKSWLQCELSLGLSSEKDS